VIVGTSYSDCEFPRQWWGRWHQTGIGELIIRANEISTKGTCYEQYRDYFLVENRWVNRILEYLSFNIQNGGLLLVFSSFITSMYISPLQVGLRRGTPNPSTTKQRKEVEKGMSEKEF